ncbi:hypothetical protein NST44_28870 [Paenibacillus sp. FSL W8-0919]|uniref:hypothetical protein n=1 Tax=Paenibacillus sp. FSL W8-0919 TaxID=2954707 RepID=UPI0030FB4476
MNDGSRVLEIAAMVDLRPFYAAGGLFWSHLPKQARISLAATGTRRTAAVRLSSE